MNMHSHVELVGLTASDRKHTTLVAIGQFPVGYGGGNGCSIIFLVFFTSLPKFWSMREVNTVQCFPFRERQSYVPFGRFPRSVPDWNPLIVPTLGNLKQALIRIV